MRTLRQTAVFGLLILFTLLIWQTNSPTTQAFMSAPGGVSDDLVLWLRADKDVTEAGGFVSVWADQSTTGTDASQATVGDQPTFVPNAMNFNPALHFDNPIANNANQYLAFNPAALPGGTNDRTFIIVAAYDNAATGVFHVAFGYSDQAGTYADVTQMGVQVGVNPDTFLYNGSAAAAGHFYTDSSLPWPNNPTITSGVFAMVGTQRTGYLYQNALTGVGTPHNYLGTNSAGLTFGAIGAHPYVDTIWGGSNQFPWNGHIAEIIVYSDDLSGSSTDRQKIESYLALKYGITLDQSTPTDYLDSDGAVVWNAATNAAYNNDIAGLGRDDNSGLNQLQSKSVNLNTTVMMTTTGFTNDRSFVVWGNDGAPVSFTDTGAPAGLEILQRTWRVQTTGTHAVAVCTTVANATHLLVSADSDFSSGATDYELTDGCTDATVSFDSGDYFTFAQDVITTTDIFNQDGIGFSGMIAPNPLPNELMMSSYQNWPVGYNDGAFIGTVFDGENMWLVPYNANQVVKIAPDGTMTEYSNWPGGFTKGLAAFEGGVYADGKVWLVPHLADKLISIDMDGNMTSYGDWPVEVNLWLRSFVGGVYDGEYIWLIPFSASHLVRVDPSDGSMVAYGNWQDAGYFKGFWSFRGGVFDGQNIWLIPYFSTHLIKFNPLDGSMQGYGNWWSEAGLIKTGAAFAGGVFDGDDLWLIPFYADRVVKFDTTTETMTGYNNWPTGFFKTLGAFYGGGFDGQYIWMVPATANQVMRVDKDTGAMTGYNIWPNDFYKFGRYFYGGGFDGDGLWLTPLISDRAIRLHKIPPASPIVITPVNGSVTNLDPLPFLGIAEPGTTVEVRDDDGNLLCSDVADGSGNWSCDVVGLPEDDHTFHVVAIDGDDDESAPTVINVTTDTTNPSLAVMNPVNGTATFVDPPPFNGTSAPGATITVTDSDNNELCTTTADGSGNWSCTPDDPLGEEEHEVTVTAVDGPNSSAVSLSFTIDQTAPDAPVITTPENGATTGQLPTFVGTGEPGGKLDIYDDNNDLICTTIIADDGSWHCTPPMPLPTGPQTFNAAVTDAADNESAPTSVTLTISDDMTPPSAPVVTEPITGTVTGPQTAFAGTGDPGTTITVYAATGEIICITTVDNDSNWACPEVDLEEGDQSYSVTATSAVGVESFPPTLVDITVEISALTFCPGGVCADLEFWLKADGQITATNGITVTHWADESGTHGAGDIVNAPPFWVADAHNFNPAVRFANGYIRWTSQLFLTGADAAEVFYVLKPDDTNNGFPGEFAGGTDDDGDSLYSSGLMRDHFGSATPHDWEPERNLGDLHIYGAASTSDAWAARFNGTQNHITATNVITSFDTSASMHTYVGAAHHAVFSGDIAEVVLYRDELSDSDRNKIESYLALKYGITLEDDYTLSDGTVVWNATGNVDYHNDVAGIVRDDTSDLNQLKSQSVNDDMITMEATTLDDGTALIWGHNGEFADYTVTEGSYLHMERVWKVQVTGNVGEVTVTVVEDDAAYILVSSSADFSGATAYAVGSSITFTNGQYFTLAHDTIAPTFCPGGICAPALWLRADAGISASDGMTVTTWADQSPNAYTAAHNTSAGHENEAINYGPPTYYESSNLLNFNPVVRFGMGGNTTGLDLADDYIFADNDGLHIFAVVRPQEDPDPSLNPVNQPIFDFGFAQNTGYGLFYSPSHLLGYTPTEHGGLSWGNGTYNHSRGLLPTLAHTQIEFGEMQALFLDGGQVLTGSITLSELTAATVDARTEPSMSASPAERGGPVMIGRLSKGDNLENNDGRWLRGDIAEIVVYTDLLTEAEINRIDSYLALKYGVSLVGNYTLSDDTVVWDATANAAYHNDVAGIVRDDASDLNQLKSQSINDDTITMEATALDDDGDALIWGHNGASTDYNVTEGSYLHMDRIWKVQVTGSVGAVVVTTADSDAEYIWVSDSDDFSDATAYAVGSSITFTDGQYFTLAKDALTAPVITEPENGVSLNPGDDPLTVAGTAEVPDTTEITVTLYDENGDVVDSCIATPNLVTGAWACDLDLDGLDDGDYTIIAVAGDGLGNTSESDPITFTLDTTPPGQPVITEPEDGISLNPGDDPLTVVGTADVPDTTEITVTLYDENGDVVTSCTVTPDPDTGEWDCDLDLEGLEDGDYTIIAEATDAAGNSSQSDPITFTIDTTPPNAPVVTSPEDGAFVNNDPPTFVGTAEPGASIIITDEDGNVICETTADSEGNWSCTPDEPLGEGEQTFTVVAIDEAGNDSEPTELTITIDTTAPDAPEVTSPEDGAFVNDDPPTFVGTAEPGAAIVITDEDSNVICETTADSNGDWSCTPNEPLGEGEHTFEVVAIDAAGNESEPTELTITIDTIPPDAPVVTSPEDGAFVNDDPPTFVGTAEPGAAIVITDEDGNVICETTADSNGDWSCTPDEPLGEGEHTFEVVAIDAAGNDSEPTDLTITIDTIAPDAPVVTSPEDGAFVNDDPPTFIGTAEPGAAIVITDEDGNVICETTADSNGDWSCTPNEPLGEGEHTFIVIAIDAAGNESEPTELTITIDTTPPDAPVVTSPISGTVPVDNPPTFIGTGEPGATIIITDEDGNVVCETVVGEDGNWECTPDAPLAPGNQTFVVTAVDLAGNVSDPIELMLMVRQFYYLPIIFNGGSEDEAAAPVGDAELAQVESESTSSATAVLTIGNLDLRSLLAPFSNGWHMLRERLALTALAG